MSDMYWLGKKTSKAEIIDRKIFIWCDNSINWLENHGADTIDGVIVLMVKIIMVDHY